MGKQIADVEDRIVLIFPDADGHIGAVLLGHDPVQRKRQGHPLILLDAAVIVRLEESDSFRLIKRVRPDIKPGAVDVSRCDEKSIIQRFLSHDCRNEALVLVEPVDPVACLILLAGLEDLEFLSF